MLQPQSLSPPVRRMDSLRYATSAVGALFTKGRKRLVGDTVLSVRTTASAFMNSYPGVCGRRREGQMCVRATAPPSSPHCLSATTPPPARRRLTGTPVRSWRTDGRTTYAAGRRSCWTAHEDDAAARLFATNILQLLTLNFERSRNIVLKISQENQSPENAIRLIP